MTNSTTGAPEEMRDPNVTPPMGQAIPLGIQHVLAMFASNVTPSVIVAGAAGLAFGSAEQVYLIQMAMLFAGIATLFQTIGMGPIGARLPIMQGTSFAFVGVLAGIAATQGLGVVRHSIDHHSDTIINHLGVVVLMLVIKTEPILESRATTTRDKYA